MKKLLFAIFALFTVSSYCQEKISVGVEESIYGIRTGLFGVWSYNETKLSNKFALRTDWVRFWVFL